MTPSRPRRSTIRSAQGAICLLAVVLAGLAASAATVRAQIGSNASATPGLHRVLVATETEPGVDAALVGGAGVTEDVLGTSDTHVRVSGSAAVAGRPIPWLTIGARFDGRWDHHLVLGRDDQSAVGEPQLLLRGDVRVSPEIALGLAALVTVPGADAPSFVIEATSLALRALGAWTPAGSDVTFALDLGWRFDGSARAVTRPITFGRADLVSLGASDSDALMLGLGAVGRLGTTELFGEVTADVLVENDLPASRVGVAAGVRVPLVERLLSFYAAVEVGLGGRAAVAIDAQLAPIDPRFAGHVGLVLSPRSAPAVAVDDAEGEGAPEDGRPPEEGTARVIDVHGRVLDADGAPIAGARVHVVDAPEIAATTSAAGEYSLSGVAPGAELEVEAEGYTPMRLGSDGADTVLERATPESALRGLVRSHRSRSIVATIRVEPGGATATTDADGAFEIVLPPGRYEVSIEAPGHEPQRRTIEIEVGGVTVLNVDLRRSR